MRFKSLAVASALVTCPWAAYAQPTTPQAALQATATALTLDEAWRLADAANPALKSKQAELAAAVGSRADAAAPLYNNPELALENTRRSVTQTDRLSEWSAGISQTFEVAGQRGHRLAAGEAALTALRAEIEATRRQVRAEVALAFYRVLALRQRAEVDEEALKLFENTAAAVQKRRVGGEDTKLDANVATVEAERARNQLALAHEQLLEARAELATMLQLAPSSIPDVVGDLVMLEGGKLPYGLDQLLASAQSLPKQRALLAREEAARARVGVERASRYPDVTVGLRIGREGPDDARERVTTLSLSVPLPLFKHNDAAIGQALSEATQAEIERSSATRDVQAQVRRLWIRLDSQGKRLQRLQQTMVVASIDNQQLAAKSRQAGQIGVLDQLLVNRQALDARRELNEVLAEFHTTRIELENAAGWSQEGSTR